jgi:hypothetical protein
MDRYLWRIGAEAAAQSAGEAAAAGTRAEALRDENRRLERRLDKLTLVCQALYTLLRERAGITDDDLSRRIEELDLSDGRLDGRAAPAVRWGKCGRNSSRRHEACLYCGTPRMGVSPFERV